jgi:hypothetical protein
MVQGSEPDLSLAISLLQGVRETAEANAAYTALTSDSVDVTSPLVARIVLHRLRQNKSQFPLHSLTLDREQFTTTELVSALAATTTLTSLTLFLYATADKLSSSLALQLKSMPTLRAVNHFGFPSDAVLELLQSRTNWRLIRLPPHDTEATAKASAFAALNRSDFELLMEADLKAPDLNRWLGNPHLTNLYMETTGVPAACFEALQNCRKLTFLVMPLRPLEQRLSSLFVWWSQAIRASDEKGMTELPAKFIPPSVVHLTLEQPTLEQVKELLATRDNRDLQSVNFVKVADQKVAAVAAELVCTDRHKLWKYDGSLEGAASTAFCQAATKAYTSSHFSSLTDLNATAPGDPLTSLLYARLLLNVRSLRSFRLNLEDVRIWPHRSSIQPLSGSCFALLLAGG